MYRFSMNRRARLGLIALGALCVALVLTYLALFFLLRSTSFREWAQAELSRQSGMEIRFAGLSLHPPLQIAAEDLRVSRPGALFFRAARLRVALTPFDLWLGTVHRVSAEQPALSIDVAEFMKPDSAKARNFGIRSLHVENGALFFKRGEATLFELPSVNLDARNLNLGEAAGISLRADVPWLQGETEVRVTGGARAATGEIMLRAKTTQKRFPGPTPPPAELLRLQVNLNAPEDQPADASVKGRFDDFPAGTGRLSGHFDARVNIDRDWRELRFSGNTTIDSLAELLGSAGTKLPAGQAGGDFSGSFLLRDKTLRINSTTIRSPFGAASGSATASFADQPRVDAKMVWNNLPLMALRTLLPAPYDQWTIDGRGQVELDVRGPFRALEFSGTARGEAISIKGGAVQASAVNLIAPFEWGGGKARVRDARLVTAQMAYTSNGWRATAERFQATGAADFSDHNAEKLALAIDAGGGKFASPDGSKVGENLKLRGPLEITSLSGRNSIRIVGELATESGEILWSKFFTDLTAQKPKMILDAEYSRAEDRLECRRCGAVLSTVGAVDVAGAIEQLTRAPKLALLASSASFSPGDFFDAFVRDNLKRQYPLLDNLAVRGAMAFQTRMLGDLEDLELDGNVSLADGELRARTGDWEIGGIGLKLPFTVRWGKPGKSSGAPRPGALAIDKIRFAGRDARLSPASVSLHQNELRFHAPLQASAFGGAITVSDLRWRDVIRSPKELTFALSTKALQLQELTEAFDWPRFSGTLTGSIPQVESAGTAVKTNGEIQAQVFGGRVRISKLEIDNPFSALAAIRLDATLANIDLEQLSKTFAFGRISGTLEGTVADLIITDGQPAQFGADLHSVDRGGEQRISVEALNKITVLSSGQSAGALYGGLAGLFDSFRYSKLGFKAILRNDRLVLRGVETRGDQEYLVVGSFLPPTVNIVSHTQTIGFSELLRRLERIQTDNPKVQ